MLNIVLYEPEIPQNTGNIGRFCVGTESRLILVGKLGFSLDDKHVKRAGLDYWQNVNLMQLPSLEAFYEEFPNDKHPYAFLSKFASRVYTEIPHENDNLMLIFGRETSGLPESVEKDHPDSLFRIPATGKVRSFNLSNSVALVGFDIIRRRGFPGLDAEWKGESTGEIYA
ncbi:tRNA/rRNA methyltransferase (SpoU) [Denitrovibrio acetiphilus DSM 12809]|uniref:Putative tRNA (cytidine(34)-2'-O)-methyltransferase n=1 Tax=Denitrovibrio acetiphilus (strain DSM 12809 / NBRC 114555 / N2460) TaxID=522772 RepID=D4H0Y4_DENA2|nr:tRNA (cytidine(34)-2'-O)-methyltransferase [Denitrovibrio acetiphilus]ADD68647.1 tRNA/rRNA methyltransferase (SpoU) [Denitrovibrio acetiphilus DSM 12809]